MRKIAYNLCLATTFFLGACGEWPPHEQELKNHFFENETDYRLLERMLLESKYLSVTEYNGTKVIGIFIEGALASASAIRSERLPDEADWLAVLVRSGIEEVDRDSYDSTAAFLRKSQFKSDLSGDTEWEVGYTNDTSLRDILNRCGEMSRDMRCGYCVSKLNNDWLIRYFWFPGSPEVIEAERSGKISTDEAMKLAVGESAACLREHMKLLIKSGLD